MKKSIWLLLASIIMFQAFGIAYWDTKAAIAGKMVPQKATKTVSCCAQASGQPPELVLNHDSRCRCAPQKKDCCCLRAKVAAGSSDSAVTIRPMPAKPGLFGLHEPVSRNNNLHYCLTDGKEAILADIPLFTLHETLLI